NLGLVVDWQRFVARTEVEDLAATALVSAAAPEDLASLVPADEDEGIRRRNVKRLAVHLAVRDDEGLANAGGDRMAGCYDPDALFLADLAPGQIARRSHQPAKYFGMMARMEDDEPHAVEHSLLYPVDDPIFDLAVRHVSPPGQNVGVGKD